MDETKYVGFWVRFITFVVDSLVLLAVIVPLLLMIYGGNFIMTAQGWLYWFINYIFPALAILTFWLTKSATPGKMLFKAVIVDANSHAKLTLPQSLIRYLGYYVSAIPLLLGLIWVAFDQRKQGWHDKLAGTVVIYRSEP
ncbi:MAG: RDD family protein [Cellvibrionaceae bacterium]|nr:RDD family protein [Cellvibrionaceae bacterium]MCV6628159.1 RDD family protein [Cellvibrionaceae bacterium]